MSVSIETDLKEILTKIDNRLDNLQKDMTDVKVSVAEQKKDIQRWQEKIESTSERLGEKIDSTSKRLEEKIDSLSKRVDNAEFINRGVFVGLLLLILGGAAKLLGLVNNP
jgi:peptidoglycan hydrolase CwlO-like protein